MKFLLVLVSLCANLLYLARQSHKVWNAQSETAQCEGYLYCDLTKKVYLMCIYWYGAISQLDIQIFEVLVIVSMFFFSKVAQIWRASCWALTISKAMLRILKKLSQVICNFIWFIVAFKKMNMKGKFFFLPTC